MTIENFKRCQRCQLANAMEQRYKDPNEVWKSQEYYIQDEIESKESLSSISALLVGPNWYPRP